MNKDRCEFCEGRMEPRVIRTQFHYKGHTIYVDRVPAWVCNRCGEKYLDAPVYKQLEAIARHRRRITKTVSVPLADFEKAPA